MKSRVYETRGYILYSSGNSEPTEILRGAKHGHLCTLEKYSSRSLEDGWEEKETSKEDSLRGSNYIHIER